MNYIKDIQISYDPVKTDYPPFVLEKLEEFYEKITFKEKIPYKYVEDLQKLVAKFPNVPGFKNYLAKHLEVLHLPHSSRPWKQLKYTRPILYYFKKLIYKRDRI